MARKPTPVPKTPALVRRGALAAALSVGFGGGACGARTDTLPLPAPEGSEGSAGSDGGAPEGGGVFDASPPDDGPFAEDVRPEAVPPVPPFPPPLPPAHDAGRDVLFPPPLPPPLPH